MPIREICVSGDQLYVDMQMSVVGIKKGIYTINTVKRDEGWMAWTLDYSRKSDVQDMIGYWRVEQVSSNPPRTRLDYSTQMKARGVPNWLVKLLTKKSAAAYGTPFKGRRLRLRTAPDVAGPLLK